MNTTFIELFVDGNIVDLNRIPLPADTPIIDERFNDTQNKAPNNNPPGRAENATRPAEGAQFKSDEDRLSEAQLGLDIAQKELAISSQQIAASLSSARAKAEDARFKAVRIAQLFTSKLVSREELDAAQTAVMQANAQLHTALASEAELAQKEMELKSKRLQIIQMELTLLKREESK